MEESETVLGLIKIGEAKYQKSLFEKGEIYMQTQEYFRKLEDEEGRGDQYEGADNIEQIKWLKLSDGTKEFEFSMEAGNLNKANHFSRFDDFYSNIYSMIGVCAMDINKDNPIPESNGKLGDFFIFIYNVKEFIKRIKSKLDSMNSDYTWGWVNYYDECKYEGELTLLHKPEKFKDQREVRFIVHSDVNKPLVFEIGSLADITMPFRIEDLKTLKLVNESVIQIGTKNYND
ncbi:MAG: hypothetical protein ABIJ97_09355 [Bacteroidota bacterium]